jgi:hypothetical protein
MDGISGNYNNAVLEQSLGGSVSGTGNWSVLFNAVPWTSDADSVWHHTIDLFEIPPMSPPLFRIRNNDVIVDDE